jgi:hypothetical protein
VSKVQDLVAGDEEEDVSYLREMLTSQASIVGVSGAVALGAILSIPMGVGVGAIPIVAAVAGQSIAALFVPSSPAFRSHIDRKRRRERRERRRQNLIDELSSKVDPNEPKLKGYFRMRERLESLQRLADSRGAALSDTQLESLDEASVDYLALWLALLAMQEHGSSDVGALQQRLAQVHEQLAVVSSATDRKHLERAQSDLENMLRRRDSVRSRSLSVETAMLSMADAFEEVYQRIVANPSSASDVTRALDEAVDHLRVEEELDLAVDRELEALMSSRRAQTV